MPGTRPGLSLPVGPSRICKVALGQPIGAGIIHGATTVFQFRDKFLSPLRRVVKSDRVSPGNVTKWTHRADLNDNGPIAVCSKSHTRLEEYVRTRPSCQVFLVGRVVWLEKGRL